jgi:hypothetical protein
MKFWTCAADWGAAGATDERIGAFGIMNNRLPRPQREALRRQDAPYLKQPLVWQDARSVSAQVRHMVDLLQSKRSPSPCSDATTYIAGLFERTLSHIVPLPAQQAIACKKGCGHCCVQPVSVSPMEAFTVARQIRGQADIVNAMRDAGEKLRQAPKHQRLADMRCPMLVDNACSIYEFRPFSCHNFASFNVNDCIARFVMRGPSNIRLPVEYGPAANECRLILFAALGLIGRRDFTQTFEMKAVVSAILSMDEDAEARWLDGENVLKDVEPLPAFEPVFVWDINRLIGAIGPTV